MPTAHDVTSNKRDQYAVLNQQAEFPTIPVRAEIVRLPEPDPYLSFEKIFFDKEVDWDKWQAW